MKNRPPTLPFVCNAKSIQFSSFSLLFNGYACVPLQFVLFMGNRIQNICAIDCTVSSFIPNMLINISTENGQREKLERLALRMTSKEMNFHNHHHLHTHICYTRRMANGRIYVFSNSNLDYRIFKCYSSFHQFSRLLNHQNQKINFKVLGNYFYEYEK